MKTLTVAYMTARKEPHFEWFLDSLKRELGKQYDSTHKIIVDLYAEKRRMVGHRFDHVECKPNVWQGPHRLTKEDFWAKAACLNTAICMCKTDWIAFIDDRSLILPGWLRGVQRAMVHGYAVCGSYEKVDNLVVENGQPKTYRRHPDGRDHRRGNKNGAVRCHGSWWFGCNNACPLEWALQVNGYDETCDGCSAEDVFFGFMLQNNNLPIMYDVSMKILEDRTAGQLTGGFKRMDKGVSPLDKSHKLVEMLANRKRTIHQWDLRAVRDQWQRTGEWPIPTGPDRDFYDGQKLSEM